MKLLYFILLLLIFAICVRIVNAYAKLVKVWWIYLKILSKLRLFSQRFSFCLLALQMSYMKLFHVLPHSNLTICTSMELHFLRMASSFLSCIFCEPSLITMLTIKFLICSFCSFGWINHLAYILLQRERGCDIRY